MGKHLIRAASSYSQLFSLVVLLSTAPSAFCASPANTASFTQGVQNFNAKNYAGALKSLSAYIATNPNDYKGHFYLANSLVKLGRLDEASDEYRKVLTMTPDANVGNYSMGAFNRISELRTAVNSSSLPAPPLTQITRAQTQFQPTQISTNIQFGSRSQSNFYNNAGNSNDLIPASVAGSGAKLSPTVGGQAPNSFGNSGQFGGDHGNHFQNQGFNPYMNGAPSGPMPSMNYPGQFGNSQFGGNPFPMGRHHHGRRFQPGFMGGGNNNYVDNNIYAGNASRYHTGGYIKNYEITDTPSGDAVPLAADQKKFEDFVPPKIAATKPKTKTAMTAPKVAQKKVLNRN